MKKNNLVKKAAETMIKDTRQEWPPRCTFLVYQPIRPKTEKKTADGMKE